MSDSPYITFHTGKGFPLVLLLALIGNLVVGTYYLSRFDNRVNNNTKAIADLTKLVEKHVDKGAHAEADRRISENTMAIKNLTSHVADNTRALEKFVDIYIGKQVR